VVRGDTPLALAQQYEIDASLLVQANPGLDSRRLQIGQELVIPRPGEASVESELPELDTGSRVVTHTVRSGETLLGIASEYAVTLNDIYALNPGVSPQFLSVGQILRIGLGPPTPTATSTPLPTATAFPYPAPVLLGPPEGEDFRGADSHILLWWTSVGILDEEESYVVRLLHAGRQIEGWTRAPSWRVSSELYPSESDSSLFQWEVSVRRADGTPSGETISPASFNRGFFWR
jgi:LysM repeat protein